MRRRQFLAAVGGAAVSALIAACGGDSTPPTSSASPGAGTPAPSPTATAMPSPQPAATPTAAPAATPTAAQAGAPFKIGLITALSGGLSASGQRHLQGMQLALEEIGETAGGRKLELLPEDSPGNPEQALTKLRKLVESDNVDIVTGITLSNEMAAIRDYIVNQQVPFIASINGWPPLTRDPNVRSEYIFRTSFTQGQFEFVQAKWAAEKRGLRSIALLAPDYVTGHTVVEIFRNYFQQGGGQVLSEVFPPLNTQDFGPYLQRVLQEAAGAEAVWAWFIGADAIRFMTQFTEFGLKDQYALLGGGEIGDDPYLPEVGEAALGIVSSICYAARYDTPENREFTERFQQKFGNPPGHLEYWGYITIQIIARALDALDGDTSDTAAFLEAIRNVRFNGPMGEVRFHPETQGVINTVVIREVQQLTDGSLGNVVLDVFPNIDDLAF
ncbi:ABC transporter substrate-binding protein [Thermalbibacter longus]